MAYFPDMTPYVYLRTGEKALNIGWLDENHPFTTGEVDELFWNRLVEIITHQRVMRTLGSHPCPFCPVPPGTTRDDAEEIASGSAEIRVQGKNGQVYACPVLIYHYIQVHHYLPPEAFVEAVRTS